MDNHATLLVIGTLALGSLIQGIAGFGLGLFAMGLLATLLPVSEAVVTVALVGLASTAYNLWSVRGSVSWPDTWPVLVTSIPAAALGAYWMPRLPADWLKRALAGMILLGCCATFGTGELDRLGRSAPWAYLAGAIGGLWGGALNVGGPPAVLYTLWRGWDKHRAKAVLSAYFFASSLVRVPTHFVTGAATPQIVARSLVALPCALLFTHLGTRVFQRLTNRYFRYATLALLVAMSIQMLLP